MKVKLLAYAGIAFALTFAVYVKSARYEFISMDDPEYVLENMHMIDGLTCENVKWAFLNPNYAVNWHPMTWISLFADVSLYRLSHAVTRAEGDELGWGDPSEGGKPGTAECKWGMRRQHPLAHLMHLHNVLLHSANAALLFLLMALFVSRNGEECAVHPLWFLLLALIWSLHPLRTEVVCWISERKELVSVFWMLLCLIFYFCGSRSRFSTTPALRTPRIAPASRLPSVGGYPHSALCTPHSALFYLLSLVSYLFALLAKPVAVSLPAIIFAWDWVFCGKVRWRRFLPFAVMSAFTCFMTMRAQTKAIHIGDELQLYSRLMSMFAAPLVYVKQTFVPTDLSLVYANTRDYDWLMIGGGVLLIMVLLAVCVTWLVLRIRRMRSDAPGHCTLLDLLVFGIAWVYVGLVPMLGFVKVASQEHSDRYTYWVGCGLVAVTALFLGWVKERVPAIRSKIVALTEADKDEWPQLRKIALGCLAAAAVALGIACDMRIGYWHDTITLYRDTMAKSWHPWIIRVLAGTLITENGEEGRREAEYWVRGCATHTKCCESYLELANFLLTKPPETPMFGEEIYSEPEGLLLSIPESDSNYPEAKRLLDSIVEMRKKVSGPPSK